jgi:hypothetical protein
MTGFVGHFDTMRNYTLQFTLLLHANTLVSIVTSSLPLFAEPSKADVPFPQRCRSVPVSAESFSQQQLIKIEQQRFSESLID